MLFQTEPWKSLCDYSLESEADESDGDNEKVKEVEEASTERVTVQYQAIRYDLNETVNGTSH